MMQLIVEHAESLFSARSLSKMKFLTVFSKLYLPFLGSPLPLFETIRLAKRRSSSHQILKAARMFHTRSFPDTEIALRHCHTRLVVVKLLHGHYSNLTLVPIFITYNVAVLVNIPTFVPFPEATET